MCQRSSWSECSEKIRFSIFPRLGAFGRILGPNHKRWDTPRRIDPIEKEIDTQIALADDMTTQIDAAIVAEEEREREEKDAFNAQMEPSTEAEGCRS